VEFYQGKGRILFCQLELVDRFGVDPVATHLLERIIRDYRQPSGRAWAALAHPGGERAKIRLDELAVDYQPGWNGRVAYLDLSEAPGQAAALGPFLQGGGTLVTTFRDAAAVQSLPVKVTLEKKKFWKPEVPADPLFAGVGPSDFSFRRPLELLQVTAVDGQPVSNGVAGVIPVGRGRIVYLQVEPGQFENAWQRGKVLRIYNTLLTNLGVRSRVVPDIGAIGGYGMVEEWLTGYEPSVPDIANRPMVKESNLYRKPALDFDPNRHMVW